jgi:hypothetical protein
VAARGTNRKRERDIPSHGVVPIAERRAQEDPCRIKDLHMQSGSARSGAHIRSPVQEPGRSEGMSPRHRQPAQRPLNNEVVHSAKAGHAPPAGRIARDPRRQGGQGGQLIRRVRRASTTRNSCDQTPARTSVLPPASPSATAPRTLQPLRSKNPLPALLAGLFCASMRGGRFARLGVNVGIRHGVRFVRWVPSKP